MPAFIFRHRSMTDNRQKSGTIDAKWRALLMTTRQALIMVLGAIEDFLGLQRSIIPGQKRKRDRPS